MSTDNELKAICAHFGIGHQGYCVEGDRLILGSCFPDPRFDNDAAVALLEKMPGCLVWFDGRWRCGAYINEADSFGEAVYNAAKEVAGVNNE